MKKAGKWDKTGDKDNNQVLDEIEQFMLECENMSKVPNPQTRRVLYDNDDLLKVLDTNSDKNKITKASSLLKHKINPPSIPPKKRKVTMNPEKKKVAKVVMKALPKEKEGLNNGRVKARKLNKAEIREISEIKFVTSKELVLPKKRKIRRFSICHSFHEPTVTMAKVEVGQVWKNVTIKKELIDLTGEEDIFCTYLKFAKISIIDTEDVFEIKTEIPNVTFEPNYLCKVTVFLPKIEFHVAAPPIDLTASKPQEIIATSEKDCAGRIVRTVYNYHKIYEANQKMEDALQEIEGCLPPEDVNEDYELTFSLLTKHTDALGYKLKQTLSKIFVKNLNLIRFLDVLTAKLGLEYRVSITPKTVCFYLFSMLNQNCEGNKSQLSVELLQQIREYIKTGGIKEERERTQPEGFTKQQLEELRWQIEKYNELAIRQEQLMAVYEEQLEELGLSGIKNETLTPLEQHNVKIENGIICILDD